MGGFGGPAIAVKPGGEGDVTETHRLWRTPSATQRIGSGVRIDDFVYILHESGALHCIDVSTGKPRWTTDVGKGTWSSIIRAGDRLYVPNLSGETYVFAASPDFKELARNPLDGAMTRA